MASTSQHGATRWIQNPMYPRSFRQNEDSQPYTSSASASSFANGIVVDGSMTWFCTVSSDGISNLRLDLPSNSVSPSTARLRRGRTSSSTMSSRKTASGSNASFSRMTQSSKVWFLLMALLPPGVGNTVGRSPFPGCEAAHKTINQNLFGIISNTYDATQCIVLPICTAICTRYMGSQS